MNFELVYITDFLDFLSVTPVLRHTHIYTATLPRWVHSAHMNQQTLKRHRVLVVCSHKLFQHTTCSISLSNTHTSRCSPCTIVIKDVLCLYHLCSGQLTLLSSSLHQAQGFGEYLSRLMLYKQPSIDTLGCWSREMSVESGEKPAQPGVWSNGSFDERTQLMDGRNRERAGDRLTGTNSCGNVWEAEAKMESGLKWQHCLLGEELEKEAQAEVRSSVWAPCIANGRGKPEDSKSSHTGGS